MIPHVAKKKGGPTIVNTARTPKQRENAFTYSHPQREVVPAPVTNAPDRSWWIDARTREDFSQQAALQRERMKLSSFGRGLTRRGAGE